MQANGKLRPRDYDDKYSISTILELLTRTGIQGDSIRTAIAYEEHQTFALAALSKEWGVPLGALGQIGQNKCVLKGFLQIHEKISSANGRDIQVSILINNGRTLKRS